MTGFASVVADVFTDLPLAGDPVAVFTDAAGLDGGVIQRIARELDLSEIRGPGHRPRSGPAGAAPRPARQDGVRAVSG